MKCICGCDTKVPRKMTEVNLAAGQVAVELLAWDKARAGGQIGAGETAKIDSLVERGANCYQRLLMTLHGEREDGSTREPEAWLAESYDERAGREYMSDKGSFFSSKKLRLTSEDIEALDRKRPELSFSAALAEERGAAGDTVTALERLGSLYSEGLLSEEEFAAAKARIVG